MACELCGSVIPVCVFLCSIIFCYSCVPFFGFLYMRYKRKKQDLRLGILRNVLACQLTFCDSCESLNIGSIQDFPEFLELIKILLDCGFKTDEISKFVYSIPLWRTSNEA